MSNIFSNKYFLSAAAALIVGFAYYGYQSSDDSTSTASEPTAQSGPVVETTTVSNSDNSAQAETAEAVNSEAETVDEATATTSETTEN